jgi:hypothetical protein
MEIEQRYVVKFCIDEGMKSFDILMRLHERNGLLAFSRSTLYLWIGEARRAKTELSEIPGSGRTPHEGLATIIARRREQGPIYPRESWRNPYGSRPRRYAIICLTSLDWNASDYVGSHTR